MNDEYVLITLGVLTKHYTTDKHTSSKSFQTTFNPLFFAIANVESSKSYTFIFEAAVDALKTLHGIDLSTACRQYHADLHSGEELARKSLFPNSCKATDFAHLIGAASRGQSRGAATKAQVAWRSGIFATAKKYFGGNQDIMDMLQCWVHVTRVVPSLTIFHTLWGSIFLVLQASSRAGCKVLQTTYFSQVSNAVARERFGHEGQEEFLWIGHWWAGVQHIQPGSGCGSQPQEAWHRHGLKEYVESLKMPLPDFFRSLTGYLKYASAEMQGCGQLPDMPSEPYPDRWLLRNPKLSLVVWGRVVTSSFHAWPALGVWLQVSRTRTCDIVLLSSLDIENVSLS